MSAHLNKLNLKMYQVKIGEIFYNKNKQKLMKKDLKNNQKKN